MIASLSKTFTLYMAPLITLTAILLSLFAFLAPTIMLQDRVALLIVTPSLSLLNPANSSTTVDGPSVFLGALGSCSRSHNAAPVNCTSPSLSPLYNLSVLPTNGANLSLSAPTAMAPVSIAIAIGLSILFFFSFTLISFHESMPPKVSAFFAKPQVQQTSTWTGFFGFFIGITAFLVLRMWFGKAVEDFNAGIQAQGSSGAQLAATTGNAFTMIWVAYAFYAVPLVISMVKHNVKVAPK